MFSQKKKDFRLVSLNFKGSTFFCQNFQVVKGLLTKEKRECLGCSDLAPLLFKWTHSYFARLLRRPTSRLLTQNVSHSTTVFEEN